MPAEVTVRQLYRRYRSSVSFKMIAVQENVLMGSPAEALPQGDEGPVRDVEISPFFMAEVGNMG